MTRQEALKYLENGPLGDQDVTPIADAADRSKMAQWVKELRSGKFNQGVGSLYTEGKFCCLGVYCSSVAGRPIDELYCEEMPEDVMVSLPISKRCYVRLAGLNDDKVAFETIADIIEAVWL